MIKYINSKRAAKKSWIHHFSAALSIAHKPDKGFKKSLRFADKYLSVN